MLPPLAREISPKSLASTHSARWREGPPLLRWAPMRGKSSLRWHLKVRRHSSWRRERHSGHTHWRRTARAYVGWERRERHATARERSCKVESESLKVKTERVGRNLTRRKTTWTSGWGSSRHSKRRRRHAAYSSESKRCSSCMEGEIHTWEAEWWRKSWSAYRSPALV